MTPDEKLQMAALEAKYPLLMAGESVLQPYEIVSLRDEVAIAALTGLISALGDIHPDALVSRSLQIADAFMTARQNGGAA